MKIIKFEELNKEKNMIWLEDPRKHEYVRLSNFTSHHPNCKPITRSEQKETKWKLIGYEKPKILTFCADGHGGDFPIYITIYFWLKSYDRGMPEQFIQNGYGNFKNCFPSEAVKIV